LANAIRTGNDKKIPPLLASEITRVSRAAMERKLERINPPGESSSGERQKREQRSEGEIEHPSVVNQEILIAATRSRLALLCHSGEGGIQVTNRVRHNVGKRYPDPTEGMDPGFIGATTARA
jgi:hypothetical protein